MSRGCYFGFFPVDSILHLNLNWDEGPQTVCPIEGFSDPGWAIVGVCAARVRWMQTVERALFGGACVSVLRKGQHGASD